MKLDIHVKAELRLPGPTPATLQIEAATLGDGAQTVDNPTLTITPHASAEPFLDFYGNPCRRLMLPQGDVTVEYTAQVDIPEMRSPLLKAQDVDILQLPTQTLLYTLPSRYCQSDKLIAMALDQFGDSAPASRACRRYATGLMNT